jgi:hypothetical protein
VSGRGRTFRVSCQKYLTTTCCTWIRTSYGHRTGGVARCGEWCLAQCLFRGLLIELSLPSVNLFALISICSYRNNRERNEVIVRSIPVFLFTKTISRLMTNIPCTEAKWGMPLAERVVQTPFGLWRVSCKKGVTPFYEFVFSWGWFYDGVSMTGSMA